MAAAQPPLTEDQKQFVLLVRLLKKQYDDQVRLSPVGMVGLGLLGLAAVAIWRRT